MPFAISKRIAVIVFIFAVIAAAPAAQAATFVSVASGDWNQGSTWNQFGAVPTAADAVQILDGHTVTVTGTTDVAGSVSFMASVSGATLMIDPGAKLTVTNSVTLDDGGFTNVTVDAGSGTLVVGGSITLTEGINGGVARLKIGNGGGVMADSIIVSGFDANDMRIEMAGNALLQLRGNLPNGATLVNGTSSLVSYAGTGFSQTAGSYTYQNLSTSNANGVTTAGAITVNGNLSISSGFFAVTDAFAAGGTASLQMASGTFLKLGTGTILNNVALPSFSSYALAAGSTIYYGARANQSINAAVPYQNLEISYTGSVGGMTKSFTGNTSIAGNLVVDQGTTSTLAVDMGTGVVDVAGHVSGDGLIAFPNGGELRIGGDFNSHTGTFNAGTGKVVYDGGNSQAARAGAYNDLVITGTNTNAMFSGAATAGSLDVDAGAFMDIGSTFSVNNNGAVTIDGTVNGTGDTLTINHGLAVPIYGSGQIYANVSIGQRTFDATSDLLIGGNLTVQSGVTATNDGSLTILNSLNGADGTAMFINGSNASLSVAGNVMTSGTLVANATDNTVTYNGLNQTVFNTTYHHLVLTAATPGAKGLPIFPMTINGDLTISGQASVTPTADLVVGGDFSLFGSASFTGGTSTYEVKGDWIRGGVSTFAAGTSTVKFNGLGAQSIGASNFHTVWFDGSGTKTIAGNLDLTGDFTILSAVPVSNSSSQILVGGSWNDSGNTFSPGSGIVQMNGTGARAINTGTFNDLQIDKGTGSVLLGGNVTVLGDFMVTSGTFALGSDDLDVAGDFTVDTGSTFQFNSAIAYVAGNIVTNGTLVGGTGTLLVDGTTAIQNWTGSASPTAHNLTVNKASGSLNPSMDLNVDGFLTLTNGVLSTGTSAVKVTSGQILRTNGYVDGRLDVTHSTAGAKLYPLGTTYGYSPVTATITGAGQLDIEIVDAAHPANNSANVNVLQTYWTVHTNGTGALDLQFVWPASAVNGTESSYVLANYTGSTWTTPASVLDDSTHTASVTGTGGTGDWTTGVASSFTAPAYDLVITSDGNATAGAAESITITAKDGSNATITTFNGDHTLVFNGASFAPGGATPYVLDKDSNGQDFGNSTVLTFVNGVATTMAMFYAAESASIYAEEPSASVTGSTHGVSVAPASASALEIASINNGNPIYANFPFTLNVQVLDAYGNSSVVALGTQISLTYTCAGCSGAALGGTLTANIVSNDSGVTFEDLTWPTADTNLVLTATSTAGDNLGSDTAPALTVNAQTSGVIVTTNVDNGAGSLREAISKVNSGECGTPCNITFDILPAGAYTFQLTTRLPDINYPVFLDGQSQDGFTGTPILAIDGTTWTGSFGLGINGGSSTVRGFIFKSLGGTALQLASDGNIVQNCWIGTDLTGTTAAPNGVGINVNGNFNTIGGNVAASRNVISGNSVTGIRLNAQSNNNAIRGNYIGTSVTGTAAIPNAIGVLLADGANTNVIGGTTAAERNVISGNSASGIALSGTGTVGSIVTNPPTAQILDIVKTNSITGNYIGVAANGTTDLGNATGIDFQMYATDNTVGNGTAAGRNVISGNATGIYMGASSVANNTIRGNYIGVASDGTTAVANDTDGILLGDASNNVIGGLAAGDRNVIANSGQVGVTVTSGTANAILGNSIYNSATRPIDLNSDGADAQIAGDVDAGANGTQNWPVLVTATISGGNLTATWNLDSTFSGMNSVRVELFEANSSGEPVTSLGSQCVLGNNFNGAVITVPAGSVVSNDKLVATATHYTDAGCTTLGDGTSEVSPVLAVSCPSITVAITGPTQMCAGSGPITLTAPAGYTYLWNNSATTQTITVNPGTTATYSVIVTDANGCTGSDSHTVTVDAPPVGAISGPASACDSATLTASGGTSYLWAHGPTTPSITVTSSGTYAVTVTGPGGCQFTTGHAITINPSPSISISGPATACGSATLTAPPGYSYSWSNLATTQSITVTASGTYNVTVTDGNGCTATAAHTVTITANPTATITATGPTTFCDGGSVTLTASGGSTYQWSNGATTSSIVVTTGGSYTVTAFNGSCQTTSAPTVVNVNPPVPAFQISGPTTACGSATLTAPAGYSYVWSTTETTQSITVTAGGTYNVTITDANGCSASDTHTVSITPAPTATITPSGPTTFCAGGSVTLTASGGSTYQWSNGATTPSIVVNTGGSYTVTAFNGSCQTTSAPTVVTVNPAVPGFEISGPATACDSAALTAPAGYTYQWTTGATAQSITVTTGGTYGVTITDANGCTASDTHAVTITATPAATITASGPTTLCDGGSVTLTASAASSYLWSNGATTPSIVVSTAGSYSVTTTNGSCQATSAPTVVTVNTPQQVAIAGPTSACDSAVLDAGPNFVSYVWSTQETTPTINVTTSGTYSVTVTDSNGCTSTASHTITINGSLQPQITGPATACASQTVTLDAGAGFSAYNWSTGDTTRTITVSASGTYSVTVTGAGGCQGTDSHAVTIFPAVNATITPSGPTTFCDGGSVTLNAGNGASYLWSNGATTPSITVSAAGSYSVTVTDANGCSATSAAVPVTVNPVPVVSITGTSGACTNDPVTLDAGPGFATYHWSTGATTQTIQVTQLQTTYSVTVTNASGCQATDSISLPGPPPQAAPQIQTAPMICAGATATATAFGGSGTNWTITNGTILSGQGTTSITYKAGSSGNVGLDVTGACGFHAMKSVTITPPPVASITVPSSAGANATIVASVPLQQGAAYVWTVINGAILLDQGTSAVTLKTGPSGTTTVKVDVSFNGCTSSDTKVVNITGVPAPEADVAIVKSGPSSVQAGAPIVWTLTVSNNGPSTASAVTVVDQLPAGVVVTNIDDGPWNCANSAGRILCDGSLANGATSVITITATAPQQGGAIVNSARVETHANDPFAGNNSSSATTNVTAPDANCSTVPPSLLAPAQNASVPSPVTFSWSAVQGATEYEVWIVSNDATLLAGTTNGTSLTKALASGTSNWYVVARFAGDCTPLVSAQRTFIVAQSDSCATQAAPQLTAPAAGSNVPSNVTFSWTAVPQAIGYRVWIEANGTAAQDVGTTNGAITLNANLPTGAIVAYVDALFSGCPSTRSAPVRFTVPTPNPCEGRSLPVPQSPSNDATLSSSVVDFSWSAASNVSEYRLWVQLGTAAPVVVATTSDTTHTATFAPGTIAWWVEALYDGCSSLESQRFRFTIPQRNECSTQKPELIAPANNSTLANGSVTFSWSAVANATGYEVWLLASRGTPTLIGTTTSTSLTHVVNAGMYDWFVRALVDRCPSRDSDSARFTHTPTDACAANQRPLAIAPLAGGKVTSPVSFSWSPVAGATGYEVFTLRGNQAPQLLGSATGNTLNDVAISNGRLRWFVRAKFNQCAPLDSAEQKLEVVAEPAACETLVTPEIFAAGQISSGVPFLIQWTPVAGATSYQLQLASSPNFANAELISTAETQHALTRENNSKEQVAIYARVRAIDSRCKPDANVTPYGPHSAIFILPIQGTEAAAPAAGGIVTFKLPLGPEFAGQAFSVQFRESWLTVAPASGIVPEGGTTIVVSANTSVLPLGTSLAAIRITLTTPSSSRVSTNATTVVIPNVGASKSTPVSPEARSTPPPDALIIPAVAHADGMNSKFQSDVRVSNTGANVMQYQMTFTPSGDTGLVNGKATTFAIEPGQTIALDDIMRSWFGTGTGSAVGTLEIRPVTDGAASLVPPSAFDKLANLTTFASSRTFNVTANGTFGQYVPAIPFASFVGRTDALDRPTSLSLQQIAQSEQYRTNLGFVEASGEAATVMVSVYGAGGQKVTEFPVNLAGGQHTQLNSFLLDHGVGSLSDGRVEIQVVSPGGKITAYASVLDNATNDPLLVTPVTLTETGANKWVMPGVADLTGIAQWQTDMRIFNAGTADVDATLKFYSQNGGAPKVTTVTVPAGQVRQFDKTLSTVFGVSNDGGSLHIETPTAARLVATSRTFSQTSNGTYGQFVSAITPGEAAGIESRALQILQVEESGRFRSNVGIVEVTGNPVTVELSIVPPDSKFTYITEVPLAANEFRQLGSVLRSVGLSDTFNARVTVRVVQGTGRVTAFASVIDQLTNDPTYVPAQ